MNNKHELVELANARMPFGKHQGKYLIHLPEHYLIWLNKQEMVNGKLALQLEQIMTIKLNGLETIIKPLIKL